MLTNGGMFYLSKLKQIDLRGVVIKNKNRALNVGFMKAKINNKFSTSIYRDKRKYNKFLY